MILETINSPADVKCLSEEQTATLCRELRSFLVEQVSRTGGHLASNLGVVELTVAIHRVFDTATDRLVLDVGHQCYVHKALTGRRELFDTLGSPVELLPLRSVPGLDLQPEWVERLTAAMHAGLPLYRATRAVHSCFVLHKGEIVFACEDLGRHNALDKAVGCAVLAGLPLAECVLYTSGRVPLDMVRKAIRAGVPVLVSKSMPTVQSAELAAEYGLQLVCGRKIPKV